MTYSGAYGNPQQQPQQQPGYGAPGSQGYNAPATGGFGAQPGYGSGYGSGYGAPAAPGKGLPFYLRIGIAALGVVGFFLGFAPFVEGSMEANFFEAGSGLPGLTLVLVTGLIAAFALLPKQTNSDAVMTATALAGFLTLLFVMVSLSEGFDAGVGLILVLVLSFIQLALAVVVLLLASEVIKPRPPQQAYGGYYGQPPTGGYPQPPTGGPMPTYGSPYPPQQQ
ncbi:DUF5336 domain-containing protein [Mycobacterium sp. MYCO198283]|uniref:DUF5336 domain-containing protein n=1 Tax=Mycobacterium sp. MYCO198283 TaxID=2883505 RepID=UPI001E34615A|nr:DUF5336 domain-containing protein [Mycobacterium sp. MYCO198283]MCG5431115.1 DUF5336 domain-containing protein [Mycobacterium sp. MYCO198283]